MKRRGFIATGCVCVNTAFSGCLSLDRIKYRDESWVTASVIANNIRAGFDSEQLLEISMHQSNVMGSKLPDENQEHHIRIDVSSLEDYGVDIENLSVETTQWRRRGPDDYDDIDTIDFTDGVIEVVVLTSENVRETDPIALSLKGFQFTDVEVATKIQYNVQSPDEHVEISNGSRSSNKRDSKCGFIPSGGEFTLINPQLLSPTLCPHSLDISGGSQSSQSLYIEWLTPEEDEMFIEIDMSSLDGYATIEEAAIEPLNRRDNSDEPVIRGATLESLAIDDWTVLMRLVPDSGTNYASASVRITGINVTINQPVEGLSYEMSIEGDAQEAVETESFDMTDPPDGHP
jgi:hypothetical protein